MQPTPVLSLGFNLLSPSLSSQPLPAPASDQTSLSGWWVLVGTDPPCRSLSTLPSAPLLLCSPPWLRGFPPMAPRLPPRHPCPRQWRGFLVCGYFSSFTAPSQRCRSHPYSFVSVFSFFFCPTQVREEFPAFWEVWGLVPAFSKWSVVVVPHVDVFLMYLWGGRWSPHLIPPPYWRSPYRTFMTEENILSDFTWKHLRTLFAYSNAHRVRRWSPMNALVGKSIKEWSGSLQTRECIPSLHSQLQRSSR